MIINEVGIKSRNVTVSIITEQNSGESNQNNNKIKACWHEVAMAIDLIV